MLSNARLRLAFDAMPCDLDNRHEDRGGDPRNDYGAKELDNHNVPPSPA